ncbi:MAG: AAA family ATPase [Myxococcota bacterium]
MAPYSAPMRLPELVLDEWIDRDLSAAARQGGLSAAYEVDGLVAQCEEVLRALGSRTPVLVGAPGVGKTAIVHELIRRSVASDGVPLLREARVVQVSLRAIAARFKEKADATNFFGELCGSILASPTPVVPFFRDLHHALPLDGAPALHRLLAALPHPVLAEAHPRELEQLLEQWPDLAEHLVPIPVEEPAPPVVAAMLHQWCVHHAAATGRGFRGEAERGAIELTARFMGDRPFPRKAFELLRQTADFHASDAGNRPIGLGDVVRRFSQLTRVPPRLVDPDEQLDLSGVHDFVSERLLGQEEAVDAVVRMIALMKAGLADLRRPFGTFLFVGPTGVGKTFCAELLAAYLFGDPNRLIRLNLADHADPRAVQVLFGDPHAREVADQRGLLARRLAGNPFGVLLLDEFEKADPKVHDAFLQLVDEGRYLDGRSEVVSVASLIVIATSNGGAEVYRETGLGFDKTPGVKDLDRELDRRLGRVFRFELLNRFDRIVHFHPLDRSHIRSIARRELADLAQRDGLIGRGLHVEVDAEVLDWLVSHGYHPHFGARFLRREIERSVAGTLAEYIVRDNPPRGARLALGVRSGRIDVRTVSAPELALRVPVPDRDPEIAVDPERLLDEARAWVARWEPLFAESRARETEAAGLIDQSASPGFWDDVTVAQDVLRRYKGLDARLQADRRLLRAATRLGRSIEQDDVSPEELADLIHQAAASYRRWLDIGSEGGPGAAWLVLGPADPVTDCAEWLTDLVAMYRGWFRRRGLQYELVAEEVERGHPVRLVFEVEGPGVLSLLEIEAGEHRRRGEDGAVERAMVEVVPRREGAPADGVSIVEDARRTRGVAITQRAARVRLELPGRGLRLKLYGTSKDTLGLLVRDLGAAFAAPRSGAVEIARTYGLRGGTVYDPRTSASTANLKDVLRGNLEPFLRAWEVR